MRNISQDTIKKQAQLELRDCLKEKTERDFQESHKAIFNAATPLAKQQAIENLDKARTTLILFFDYDLQDLARLVDEITDGDNAA